jgi:hypothetical protein
MDNWPTPTPLPPANSADLPIPFDTSILDVRPMFAEAAETGVQYWNQVEQAGTILDLVYFALIALIVFGGLLSINRHLQEMD